jgi:hypothetical protein
VIAVFVLAVELKSTRLSENNRVDSFQMRGVGHQRQMDSLAGRSGTNVVHTKMVFDITRSFSRRFNGTRELTENRFIWLANNIAEDVKTTTMGHSNDDRFDTEVNRAVNLGEKRVW